MDFWIDLLRNENSGKPFPFNKLETVPQKNPRPRGIKIIAIMTILSGLVLLFGVYATSISGDAVLEKYPDLKTLGVFDYSKDIQVAIGLIQTAFFFMLGFWILKGIKIGWFAYVGTHIFDIAYGIYELVYPPLFPTNHPYAPIANSPIADSIFLIIAGIFLAYFWKHNVRDYFRISIKKLNR